jgi:hypothetical protein
MIMRSLGRLRFHITTTVTAAMLGLAERWLQGNSHRVDVRGIQVIGTTTPGGDHDMIPKVVSAINLIAETDPRRFARLQQDIRRIVIVPIAGARGAYVLRSRACYLDAATVSQFSSTTLTTLIVHEATHARIEHAGVRQWPDRKLRYERICVRAEIAFAERLPRDRYPYTDQWIANRRANSRALQATVR